MGAAESYQYNYEQERNRILNDLSKNKEVRLWVENVTLGNATYNNDLYQELFLHLSELDCEKLVQIETKGYLKFYILRYLTNQYRSDRSSFYKKFKDKRMVHVGIIKGFAFTSGLNRFIDQYANDVNSDAYYDTTGWVNEILDDQPEYIQAFLGSNKTIDFKRAAAQVQLTLQTFDWYERDLFLLKLESGLSYSDLAKQTHIPRNSIVQTCLSVKNKIKADLQSKKLV